MEDAKLPMLLAEYHQLQTAYLRSGLTHTLIHMRHRFPELILPASRKPSESDLCAVMIDFQLNELEFALVFLYYEGISGKVGEAEQFELLTLCGFHAKNYFNSGMETYKAQMNWRFPEFYMRYRKFANERCKQDFAPTALNFAFDRLRQGAVTSSHISFDLGYQAAVLKWETQPSYLQYEEKVQEVEDTPCYAMHQTMYFLQVKEQGVQADISVPMLSQSTQLIPESLSDGLSLSKSHSHPSDPDDPQSPEDFSFSPPLGLTRQVSYFSSLDQQ